MSAACGQSVNHSIIYFLQLITVPAKNSLNNMVIGLFCDFLHKVVLGEYQPVFDARLRFYNILCEIVISGAFYMKLRV